MLHRYINEEEEEAESSAIQKVAATEGAKGEGAGVWPAEVEPTGPEAEAALLGMGPFCAPTSAATAAVTPGKSGLQLLGSRPETGPTSCDDAG